jgi:hypothetical protein
MAKDYIFQAPWSSFFLDNELCDLSHLNEYRLSAEDSDGESREILVTFSDHCFTDKEPADPLQPQKYLYRESARRPGYFCRRRYDHSLLLVQHIETFKAGSVWNASGQNFAAIPTVTDNGAPAHYAIVFNLRRLKGTPPYHLRMDVASAYICDDISKFATFGTIGFKKLVTTTMQGKPPQPNYSKNRKRPK